MILEWLACKNEASAILSHEMVIVKDSADVARSNGDTAEDSRLAVNSLSCNNNGYNPVALAARMGNVDCCVILLAFSIIRESRPYNSTQRLGDECGNHVAQHEANICFASHQAKQNNHDECVHVFERFSDIVSSSDLAKFGANHTHERGKYIMQALGISASGARAYELAVLATASINSAVHRQALDISTGNINLNESNERQPHSPDGGGGIPSPRRATLTTRVNSDDDIQRLKEQVKRMSSALAKVAPIILDSP
jgi:hypothetical protein